MEINRNVYATPESVIAYDFDPFDPNLSPLTPPVEVGKNGIAIM